MKTYSVKYTENGDRRTIRVKADKPFEAIKEASRQLANTHTHITNIGQPKELSRN